MSNFTTDFYETKREIMIFSNKLTNGLSKPNAKFVKNMIYGIAKNQSCHLTDIARSLDEKTKLINIVDRLSSQISALEAYVSHTRVELPKYKGIPLTLILVYGLSEEKPMMLLTNKKVKEKEDVHKVVRLICKKSYFWLYQIKEGISEILKFSQRGIEDYLHIRKQEPFKQLRLNI